MRRALSLAAALGALALPSACGGDADADRTALRPVTLTITEPADGGVVSGAAVTVRGRVWPREAVVLVQGRRAAVSGGAFQADVELREGTNVIDVMASAGRRRPALEAIRVRRPATVEVPDVVGLPPEEAVAELERRGLTADVEQRDDLLGRLLGRDEAVCESDPPAGRRAEVGATVALTVSRRC
jgi:hypothetical protein